MLLPDSPTEFAEALAAALPPSSEPFRAGGAEGYAWLARTVVHQPTPVFLGLSGGRPVAGLAGVRDPDGAARSLEAVAGLPAGESLLRHMVPWPVLRELGFTGAHRPPRPAGAAPATERLAFCRRFVAGLDYEALRLVAEADACDRDAYDWLAGGHDRERRQAFVRTYPWALDLFLEAGAEFWDDTDEDAVVDLVRAGDIAKGGPDHAVRHLVRLTRGMRFDGIDPRRIAVGIKAASLLPRDWYPAPEPELTALFALAPQMRAFAAATGRAPSEVMRPGPLGWDGQVRRLLDKAGVRFRDGATAFAKVAFLARSADDMVQAFEQHVVRPAALEREPGLAALRPAPRSRETLADGGPAHPLGQAACRVLAGDKSLPGFVEAALRWHAGITPISSAVAEIAAGLDIRWPAAFAPYDDRYGIRIVCVSDAAELHQEGADLRHCVSSYLERCLNGECAIASVRRVGPDGGLIERLSTVELSIDRRGQLQVAQHRGEGNGPAPDVAEMALRRFRAGVAEGRIAIAPCLAVPWARPYEADSHPILSRLFAGRSGEMLRAWAPHLPASLRGASPDDVLAAGGLDPAQVLREALPRLEGDDPAQAPQMA